MGEQYYQGTQLSKQQFFEQQEKIPVEISPADPTLQPLQNFQAVSGIHQSLAANIRTAGYQSPTPVQKWGIPLLLRGGDVMACAQTGSGKTAFYLFPPINNILKGDTWRDTQMPSPKFIVLGPTRELCIQIHEEAVKFTQNTQVKTGVVYGGTEYHVSKQQINGGIDLCVATPGRLHDLCSRNHMSLTKIKYLVLDEADRMLDMGFEPQIRQIVQRLGMPKNRQTVMTSATFPPDVQHLATDFLREYVFVAIGRVGGAAKTIKQKLAWVEDEQKTDFLYGLLLHQRSVGLTLIFVNTKVAAVDLEKFLRQSKFKVTSIHGDRTQEERERALAQFKSGEMQILLATDVAARGLDIPNVALVIQYDFPMSIDDYVHRIGRTGRIGNQGIAVSLVNNRNKGVAGDLLGVLQSGDCIPPPWLIGMAVSIGNYDPQAAAQGDIYGGQDIRKGKKGFVSKEEQEKAKRFGNFATDAYGEGDADKAAQAESTKGTYNPGSYFGAAAQRDKGKGKGGGKGKAKGGFSPY